MIKFLDLQKQYKSIENEIDTIIKMVLSESAFVGGKYVTAFEKEFANYIDIKHCIGVGNGTDALEIALWALDLPKESEIIVPANTFIATSEAVSRNNLTIRFVDCDDYYQIDTESLEQHITKNTSAIIAVHLYGHPANMQKITQIANKYKLKVIEDAAQAHGAMIAEQKVATFGDIATFSFYPGKNLGAYGDGGAIVTNNNSLAYKIRQYSNHGRSNKFGHEFEGRNSRLDGIQAAILSAKLLYLDQWLQKRNTIANRYLNEISNTTIQLPKIRNDIYHAWHLFVIQVDNREQFINYMNENHIQTGIHYPIALPKLQAYQQECSFKACMEDNKLVSLPIGEHLEDVEITTIIEIVNNYNP